MATENPNLPAPEERVSDAAEDVQTVTSEVTSEVPETEASAAAEAEPVVETPAAEEPETEKSVAGTPAAEVPVAEAPAAEEPVAEPEAAPRAKRARIKPVAEAVETESGEEAVPAGAEVDLADEEAARAAQDAGLELEGETAEEAAADQLAQEAPSAEDKFAGKGKEELVALFMRMLEEQPVQSIRRDVEALKIAFYRIRRAEVEAARRKFVEEGGSEEDFAPAVDGAEVQLKELFKEYRHRRDEFIANLEAEKEKNLQVKLGIIEELKELVNSDETLNHTFNKFRELQQRWKETGIVPQQNVKDLWETYNLHVENFYNFIKINKELRDLDLKKNYEQKLALCEAAEALQMSEEWKKTTDELIALQARWKELGAVSRRNSDQVWKRFRAACDKFFERKAAHFSDVDGQYEQNLVRKQALLDEMAAADVKEGGFEMIKEFQRRWSEIGFVPIKRKDEIQKRYKECVDTLFSVLRGSERDRSMSRFREKVSAFKASGDRRIRTERDRLYNRVKQLESDIALLENNIGFFAHSKGAEALIADVREKIERAKREMADTIEKVKLIDREAARESEDREA